MLSAKRFSSLILCAAMLLTAAVGCKDAADNGNTMTTTSEAVESVTQGTTEAEATTEAITEAPEPEPNFEWVVEPGKFSGDIQPVYGFGKKMMDLGVMILDEEHIVDFDGNIKYTITDQIENPNLTCRFCNNCSILHYNEGFVIEPDTYETCMHFGHGAYRTYYIYDSKTGDIYCPSYGEYIEVNENIPYAVVYEGIRRPVTTEDHVDNDYVYDQTGLYGIVVNSELVVPFEYDALLEYDDSGIAALRKDGKWAFFNSEGKMILKNDYIYDSVPYSSSSGYIALNRNEKWGYADLEGNIVIDHVFEEARPVYCGKAWVKTEEGWGVIKIDEPEIITEEEAKQVIYHYFDERTPIKVIDITPNGKSYYGCEGYGFDVKIDTNSNHTSSYTSYYFVNYDGTVYCPQYYKD